MASMFRAQRRQTSVYRPKIARIRLLEPPIHARLIRVDRMMAETLIPGELQQASRVDRAPNQMRA
ncbi:hypothetical protein [Actibacterium atlanticum]|nr:hypothetical protein [Actibacterium atlanticum]